MSVIRRWKFEGQTPFPLYLAADARLTSTDYVDDQVWEVIPGSGESPAIAMQTRYGGRAGLVSLVPMWIHDGRPIYQAQAYTKPPYLTAFLPGYLRFQAALTPHLALQAEYWAIESHAVGVRFTLANTDANPIQARLELVGFVGREGKEQSLSVRSLSGAGSALMLGKIGNLQPAVVLAAIPRAQQSELVKPEPPAQKVSKLGQDFTVEGRKKLTLSFVHAGLPTAQESIALAQKWLKEDWGTYFKRIEAAAQAIPDIETSDADADLTLAYAYHELVQAELKPTASLPYGSLVASRQPGKGFSLRGDGSDYDRGWNGQAATLIYPTALALASINPEFVQGIVRNYLAVQQPDGWIDGKPGLGGQKQGQLCMPILARLAWGIFQYTEDAQFLSSVFPGLMKFFNRWFQADTDHDGDGLPEWQSENQTGYSYTPTFAAWQGWAQGADIRFVESPGLIAYLLSEAVSLKEIAYFLRDSSAEEVLNTRISALQQNLESLWSSEYQRYTYRDRDTHLTATGISVVRDGRGDNELLPAQSISPPNRLIIRVSGGVNLVPRMTMKLHGLTQDDQLVQEEVTANDFLWAGGRGVYTSKAVFKQIDRVVFDGLSRVYRIDVQTVDTTRLDMNALLPLWSAGLPAERVDILLNLLTDPNHFWRSSGVAVNSAQDANFDPSNANGSGGVWPFWATLMGEALVELGRLEQATELFRRLLNVQMVVLNQTRQFSEFYHADEPKGLGEQGHLAGIVPLHLMLRVFGVRIINSRKVWAGGAFFWERPIVVRQHGVTVRRSREGTQIEFPSGHQIDLADATWQEVIDPHA